MEDCDKHNYGKWAFLPLSSGKYMEIRTCTECGTSQTRSVERVEDAKLTEQPSYRKPVKTETPL